jgi:hypothetical protein
MLLNEFLKEHRTMEAQQRKLKGKKLPLGSRIAK